MWKPYLQGANPPLSAAEKQRRYRARRDADPERRENYLEKEHDKYRKDLESGRKKTINDLSEREKCRRRRKWRKTYHRIKDRKEALEHLITPPHSPQLSPVQAVDPQPSTSRSGWELVLVYEMEQVSKKMCKGGNRAYVCVCYNVITKCCVITKCYNVLTK